MAGIKVCLVTIILTVLYLISTVLLSNLLFPDKSGGSLIKVNLGDKNEIIGSKLIGQQFTSNIYFHGRPSLTKYKNNISGNSNFPYYSDVLKEAIRKNYLEHIQKNKTEPDLNLITESASGLDPHITYEGALSQLDRVSDSTGIDKEDLIKIIRKNAKPRIFNLLGQNIVTVLELNSEIKKIYAKTPRPR